MKPLKYILIIALVINIIISIVLVIFKSNLKEEKVNVAVQKEVDDFKEQIGNIQNYVKNGNELLSQYKGKVDNNKISLMVSNFMTDTVPKIAKETATLTTNQELLDYYNNQNMSKLTGIRSNEIEEFYTLVKNLKSIGSTELELESAEYDEGSISTDGSNTYGTLSIKYKNVNEVLKYDISVSYTSEYIKFLPHSDD